MLTPIEMQLSLKPKTSSDFLNRFLECTSKILKKKMIVIATLLRKLQAVKILVRPLSKKHSFQTLFNSQHVKGSETLAKYA